MLKNGASHPEDDVQRILAAMEKIHETPGHGKRALGQIYDRVTNAISAEQLTGDTQALARQHGLMQTDGSDLTMSAMLVGRDVAVSSISYDRAGQMSFSGKPLAEGHENLPASPGRGR